MAKKPYSPEDIGPSSLVGTVPLKEDEKGSTWIAVRSTQFKGQDRIDIRKWVDLPPNEERPRYNGPTKQGVSIPLDRVEELISVLQKVKENKK